MNRFETLKQTKDGLDILGEIPRFARDGFDSIPEDDLERLKWAGMFHRKPTKPFFMMRIRFPNGIATANQIRAVANIITVHGRSIADLTTRQQIEPRWLPIEAMPAVQDEIAAAGLTSLQTGMDNVRGVVGCALAGLYPRELVDASPVCREFQDLFVGDRAFTNLPRKFNVAITGCPDNCIDAESQDVALVPAISRTDRGDVAGFNVLVGGKMGSGGFRLADPLDVFVEPPGAAALCRELVLLFRDFGPRETRSRARFAFLIEDRGICWVRDQLEERLGRSLATAGDDIRSRVHVDHIGVTPQRQAGLYAVALVVPVGRVRATQLRELANLADSYGRGEVRLTTEQNVIVPHVPAARLETLLAEPLLEEWRPDADPAVRGLIACTGTDFCNLALIETKGRALQTSRYLAGQVPSSSGIKIRWSGCPAACGNHHAADIGLQGKRIRTPDGRVVEAVTISTGGRTGPDARPAQVVREDVVCDERLTDVLAEVIRTEVAAARAEPAFAVSGGRLSRDPMLVVERREGVRYPKFADKFARLDFDSVPMPVIALYPIPEPLDLGDLEIGVAGLDCKRRAIPWEACADVPRYALRNPLICQIFNWAEVVEWEGVRLADFLDLAGVETHAEGFVGVYSRDGVYFEGLSMAEARDPRTLLATGLNREPLPLAHGGPLRLVVPFLQGYKSVKWVGGIQAYRHDPVGIKRLLAQSKVARLAPPWRERYGIVPPTGMPGDPDPGLFVGEPLTGDEIAPLSPAPPPRGG